MGGLAVEVSQVPKCEGPGAPRICGELAKSKSGARLERRFCFACSLPCWLEGEAGGELELAGVVDGIGDLAEEVGYVLLRGGVEDVGDVGHA